MTRFLLTCAVLFVPFAVADAGKPQKPSSPSYSVVKLDHADGTYVSGVAFDINDFDEVVGHVSTSIGSPSLAAFWTTNGSSSQISTLAGGNQANAINNAAEVVGEGYDGDGNYRGMYWSDPTADPLILPPLAGGLESITTDINDEGIISGYSQHAVPDANGQPRPTRFAVAWRVTFSSGQINLFGPVQLPTLDDQSLAFAVSAPTPNGRAYIVGGYQVFNNGPQSAAVQWEVQTNNNGSFSVDPIPTILEFGEAVAEAVTSDGVSCGSRRFSSTSPTDARTWSGTDGITLDPAGLNHVVALDRNTDGVTVGWGGPHSLDTDALVWPGLTSSPVLLSKFLPKRRAPFVFLSEANAINTSGKIVGAGWNGSDYNGFLAVPK